MVKLKDAARRTPRKPTPLPPRQVRILDAETLQDLIRSRQERGIDKFDEVWEGVYVVPPLANNPHQSLVAGLSNLLYTVVNMEGRGRVFPGANVSDRREGWEHNYRCPDVVVVLVNGKAVDCDTHFMGGPDFLIELQSPGDETEDKIPFYSQLEVRELLIIHRDTYQLRLLRHDGQQLVEVSAIHFQGKKAFVSEVVPLAFRRSGRRDNPRLEVARTDETAGRWVL